MNVYILVLILGIYTHMPRWFFWVLFAVLFYNTYSVNVKDK